MPIKRLRSTLARRHNVRAHFWQSLANYCQQASGLVLGVLLARLLAPENFGEFAYALSVVGLFLLPASWSLAPQIVAEIHTHPEIVDDALWVSRRIIFARALLALGACAFLGWSQGASLALLGAIIALPQAGSEILAVLRATLEGRGQFKVNFYDSMLTTAVTATIALPLAWFGAGTWSLVAPALPLYAAQVWLFTKESGCGLAPAALPSGRTYFRTGFTLWTASIGEGSLVRADKFLLGQLSTLSALGDYNRASNYAPISVRLMNSLLTNPTVAGLARAKDSFGRLRLIAKSAGLLAAGGLINFAVLWWFSAPLVPWLFGPQWAAAIPVFEAMAPLSLATSFAYLPTSVALAKRAYTCLAMGRIVSLVVFLAAALWLGSQLDAVTMAWLLQGTLIVQGTVLSVGLLFRP